MNLFIASKQLIVCPVVETIPLVLLYGKNAGCVEPNMFEYLDEVLSLLKACRTTNKALVHLQDRCLASARPVLAFSLST